MKIKYLLIVSTLLLNACGGGGSSESTSENTGDNHNETPTTTTPTTTTPVSASNLKVLAFNDLGMHCIDKEYSVFSILPPYNVLNTQVIQQGSPPKLLDTNAVSVGYTAVADAKGSINSSSTQKTNFWQYSKALFGLDLKAGEGLKRIYMPADDPQKRAFQPMDFSTKFNWFNAEGIPITPFDDILRENSYPLLKVGAYDKNTGSLLASTDAVVPVSRETDCKNCHSSGQIAASSSTVSWANDADMEIQAKKNILILHDVKHATNLKNSTPILCASCHYSAALDLAGAGAQGNQIGKSTMSQAMHRFHGDTKNAQGQLVFPDNANVDQTCYQCHPGRITQCQRGAMKTGGMTCQNCHGNMAAVGGKYPLKTGGSLNGQNDGKSRAAWLDVPRCQSCHTGDAANHLTGTDLVFNSDGFRLKQAYKVNDLSASPIAAPTSRFAENSSTLYRHSKGHGNVACEGCHGSTHAEFPNADPASNDNVASQQLQGHTGVISECKTCHTSLALTINGPHGMHNVGDQNWADGGHRNFYRQNPDNCRACHGKTLDGSPLSKVAQTRSFNVEGRNVTFNKGDQVACNRCHSKP
ncbi:MAG: hypothetical protein RIT27_826 [Pseudomonadota bacterium]|jgi:hypothetical protein